MAYWERHYLTTHTFNPHTEVGRKACIYRKETQTFENLVHWLELTFKIRLHLKNPAPGWKKEQPLKADFIP